jgi:hypothetical protein
MGVLDKIKLVEMNRQIVAPVIDHAPRLAVRPVDDALMRANHVPLGNHYQPLGVNAFKPLEHQGRL